MSWKKYRRRALEILDRVLERPENERAAYLDEACGGDEELRGYLDSMLAAGAAASVSPLDAPVLDVHAEDPAPGDAIDGYRLLETLGQGGMGTVYLAEREDYGQRVALKVIHHALGFDPTLVQRFETERRILARLEHPHIARILDGGTTEGGLPYFVMEHVDGEPIDRYCGRHGLGVRQRLRLFLAVCDAVEYAHRNLVVHRDLKPGNILITPEGEPKLLDFGIAKPLDESLQPVATETGQRPMTPRYASPEQVRMQAINTVSDVYTLGVLLYELLAGESPYRLQTDNSWEMSQAVCEQQPARPSVTLARSQPERRDAARRLRGDLDSITLRALHKEPEARYGSARELAEDIERHLQGRPVAARDGSWLYRSAKLVRRQWVGVAVVTAFVVLSAAFGLSTRRQNEEIQLRNEQIQQKVDELEEKTRSLNEATEFFKKIFRQAKPDHQDGSAGTVDELLNRGMVLLDTEPMEPDVKAEFAGVLGDLFRSLGEYSNAREMMQVSLEAAESAFVAPHEEIATRLNNLAIAYLDYSELQKAASTYQKALVMKEALKVEERLTFRVRSGLATTLTLMGEFERAREIHELVYERRRALNPPGDKDIDSSRHSLAVHFLNAGDHQEAEQFAQRAVDGRLARIDDSPTGLAASRDVLGQILLAREELGDARVELEQALSIREERLGGGHRLTASTKKNLAALELRTEEGDPKLAEKLLLEALRVFERHNPDGWRTAEARSLLGELRMLQGRLDEAEPLLRKGHAVLLELRSERAWVTQNAKERLDRYREQTGTPEPTASAQ